MVLEPEEIVERLIMRKQLGAMAGSATYARKRRTPYSCGIMVHKLQNMPLLAGCTKVTIRLAVPTSSGFEFFDGNRGGMDDDAMMAMNEGVVEGVSQLQDDGSLCVEPTFDNLWMVSRDVPVGTVAVISVSCVERLRKEYVGTVGYLVVNLFGKRGTYVSRLQYGEDPAVALNIKLHARSKVAAAAGREQMSAPTIPLLGVRYTCYWGGGYPVPYPLPSEPSIALQQAQQAQMEDEVVLSDFGNYSVTHDELPVVDLLQLTPEEQMIERDRQELGALGYVTDARPRAVNLGEEAASAIFLEGEKQLRQRLHTTPNGAAQEMQQPSADGPALHSVISSFDKLGVTPFNPLRGVVVSLHRICNPEPFPTPAGARLEEVTVPNAALNLHCIFKVVVEIGGLLPGVSHVDWTSSTLAEPVFDVRRSTMTVKNVVQAAARRSSSVAASSEARQTSLRYQKDTPVVTSEASRSEGPFAEFVRNKSGGAISAIFRVFAIVPNYEVIRQQLTGASVAAEHVLSTTDRTERESRLAQSALVKLGFTQFDPGNPSHWLVVPHSWGATLLVAQGQPFTVASFRSEVPLYRGQPSDRQLSQLSSVRGPSIEPQLKAWEQAREIARCSSGMSLVVSTADASRAAEVASVGNATTADLGRRRTPPPPLAQSSRATGGLLESARLRDALLLHQRIRTVKELEATTNSVFTNAIIGNDQP